MAYEAMFATAIVVQAGKGDERSGGVVVCDEVSIDGDECHISMPRHHRSRV
jgi:hypothetical protein